MTIKVSFFNVKKNNRQNKSFNNNKIKTTTTTKTKKLKDMILYVFELIILNKIGFFVKVLKLDVGNGYIYSDIYTLPDALAILSIADHTHYTMYYVSDLVVNNII